MTLSDAYLSGQLGRKKPGRSAPAWQPLKPLKPVELQQAGFVQENKLRAKTSGFALWTVEEQLADSQNSGAADETAENQNAVVQHAHAGDSTDAASSGPDETLSTVDQARLETLQQEAYERGLADGKKQQLEAKQAEDALTQAQTLESLAQQSNDILLAIQKGIEDLRENPASWHDPLKRLALHLAEQLTLAELSLSTQSIQSLIDRCIETLDVQSTASVVVELNPSDMALLQNHKAVPGEPAHAWRLMADPHLLPGSVRVRADDAVVSDLIEHRLETLAQVLLADPKPWQAQSAFQPERLMARRGQADTIEDALPREPLNLSTMDLPDLDLPDTQAASEDDDAGTPND